MRSDEFESSVRALRRLMSLIGVWPVPHRERWYGSVTYILYFHCCTFTSVYALLMVSAITKEHDMSSLLLDYVSPGMQIQVEIVKCYVLNVQHESVVWLLRFMEKDWMDLKSQCLTCCADRERAFCIMSRHAAFSQAFTYTCVGMYTCIWLFFTQDAAFQAKFMFDIWLPFDSSGSPTYQITLSCQTVLSFCMTFVSTTVDCLFVTIILHLCGQFKILALYIEGICEDSPGTMEIKNRIRLITIRHQLLIRACEIVENAFNWIVFGQLMTCMVNIGLQGYSLFEAIESNKFATMLRLTFYLIGSLEQIFLFCIVGDYLTEQGSSITAAVCKIQWDDLPGPMRKSVILLLIRAHKLIYVTAKKFVPLSLENFTSIMKTSAAYFSVLRTVAQ